MSVRVVARIRPLLKAELEKDAIVHAEKLAIEKGHNRTVVRIPNPKNESEAFSFQFNSVYGREATQSQIFDEEGTRYCTYGEAAPANSVQSHQRSNTCSKATMLHYSRTASPAPVKRTQCAAANHWLSEESSHVYYRAFTGERARSRRTVMRRQSWRYQ